MFKYLRNTDLILRLQVFLMLFLSAGCLTANGVVSIDVLMGLWALLVLTLLFKAKINLNKKDFFGFFLLALIVVFSDFFNGERFTLTILMLVMLLSAYLFVVRVSLEKFVEAYIDVVFFLSVTSLIGYAACLTIPSLQFYNITDTGARSVANFYIYVHATYSTRNFGMFWEPGAFQAFLSLALLFEIYKKNPSYLRFILFVATSATTFSTTGYISVGLIAILVLMKRQDHVKKLRRTVVVILPLVIFLLVTHAVSLSESESSVFGKITAFYDNKDYIGGGAGTSSSVRYFAIIKPMEEFMHSPLFGCGYENLQKQTSIFTKNMNTCTFVNFLAIYGLFFGLIMIIGYAKFCSMLEKNALYALYVFLLFFVITMSENLLRCPLIIMVALYGIARAKIKTEIKPNLKKTAI